MTIDIYIVFTLTCVTSMILIVQARSPILHQFVLETVYVYTCIYIFIEQCVVNTYILEIF